ncbi:unnamed protein product (macronuclear) [Paramecium tetraurelia]|uniref:Uncharacterized protein n=1 Tax=Paramecium tetraurelia TaxID=5888 RepID=A0BHX9_PARTE|nr:uncharacterized protein GSPATT00029182001 [Paramecium tetraurelia]CAK58146.1 unnamed protein product [Paramecium tetraurelia]|eukprot:XP_001425544.1 hypothetical protein (macronuclear) [Paramecium tetraurelia strain d4-2]
MQQQSQDAEYFKEKGFEFLLRSFKKLKEWNIEQCNIIKGRTQEIAVKKSQDLRSHQKLNFKNTLTHFAFALQILNFPILSMRSVTTVRSLSLVFRESKMRINNAITKFKPYSKNRQSFRTQCHSIANRPQIHRNQRRTDQNTVGLRITRLLQICLTNSINSMKRMNRSNQEIKETRLLFQMNDKLAPHQLKQYMQQLLKRYKRIQSSQELEPNGVGWELKTKSQPYKISDDWVVIREHMLEKK